jgi:hypothetical protein
MTEEVQLILELHKDEIDDLWETVRDLEEDLYLTFYPTKYEEQGLEIDIYEIYYEDGEGYMVSEKVIIEYKKFK